MARFFIAGLNVPKGGTVLLTGLDAEHAKVLRLRVGERVIVSNLKGEDIHFRVKSFSKEGVEIQAEETVANSSEPSVAVTVLAGLPKQGERADYTVQKCTECGAARLVFFRSARCVADPAEKSLEHKLARWRKIAEEAAKQSGRGLIPQVDYAEDLGGALDKANSTDLPLLFYETGERAPLKTVLEQAGDSFSSAAILTGPEGGFEPWEVDLARKLPKFRVCSLGPRILRCETAPVAALAALMYATGNL